MSDPPLGWIILALEGLRAIAIRYLAKGPEKRAALLLSFCVLELASIHCLHSFDYRLDLTLRCPRPVLEELQPNGPSQPQSQLLVSIRTAIERALPPGSQLGRFEARAAAPLDGDGNLTETIKRIDRNLEAVARDRYELKLRHEDLKRVINARQLTFVQRVEDDDYVAFVHIMLLGSRNAAALQLKTPVRSFYDRVNRWPFRGPDYQRLFRLIEWRKSIGRRIIVPLGQSLLSGGSGDELENPRTFYDVLAQIAVSGSESREDLLREVLEALRNQKPANWQSVRNELVRIIEDEVPQ